MARTPTQCDQCGQWDDHPKWNGGPRPEDPTKHHDCLSVAEKEMLVGSAQLPGSVKASAVIRECEAGVHGDELLHFINEGHGKADLAVGALHNAAPAAEED